MKHVLLLLLGMSLLFSSLIFAGPNENAGITFDLDATTYGNQNLLQIALPDSGSYIRVDVYAQDVVNLDTYEFEVLYNPARLQYITAVPTNPITYEQNILTTNGGEALGWMIDTSIPGVLSIAYTLAGSDTLEAPEGEGLIADIVFQALLTESSYLSFGNVYYHDSYGTMDEITSTVIAFLGGVPPMPPADLTAYTDTVLQNSIRLTWLDPTENADGTPLEDLAGINVYYADDTYITSVNPGVETYAVQGLTIGEQYNFYVTAYDNETPVNESIHSDTARAMVIAPMPPDSLRAYSDYTTPNSIQLTWPDPTENIDGSPLTDLNSIDVYYADSTFIASVNPGVETYTDDELTDGQLYSYFLIARSTNNNSSGRDLLFTITLRTVGGQGWEGSTLDLLVNGTVVLDDITIPYPELEEDYTFAVNDGDSVFVDYTPGGPHPRRNEYRVYDNIEGLVVSSGVGGGVPSDVSFIAALKTESWHAGGSPIPAPPGNLVPDAIPGGIITLTWNDPTTQEDGTPIDDLAGINIYANSIFIGSVNPGVETYTVSGLIPGQYYSISVTAYDNEIPVNESEHNTVEVYNTTILYVHPDSTLNSIQTALDICTHNDTILVAAGIYYENIVHWARNTHLISESGPDSTIIDGSLLRRVIWWIAESGCDDNLIEGFTIQNGDGGYSDPGAGIMSVGWGITTIKGNILTNNYGGDPHIGCIGCGNLSAIIDNIITNNSCNYALTTQGSPTIIGNTITHNNNGIHGTWGASPTIIGNTISQNNGDGICIRGVPYTTAYPTLIDNIIDNNGSWGVNFPVDCHGTMDHCVITNNGSGGISLRGWSSLSVTYSVISNNGGDGIYCDSNSGGSAHYSDFYDNIGYGIKHPIHCMSPTVYAEDNWWGCPLGPFGPNGDGVYGDVIYQPWLTEPSIIKYVSVPYYSCGEPGDTINIPVNTTDITGEEVLSAEFTMSYDSTIITEMDIDATGTLLSGTDWTWQSSVIGDTLFVEMSGTDELTGSGTLINLVFVVSPDAQQGQGSPLHFEEFIYNEGVPVVTTQDGIFIVGQIWGAIEGTVTDAATSDPIADAIVTAQGTFTYCDTTDANGYYIMPEALSDTYDMTVTAFGYNVFDTTGVVVIGGETTVVNFAILHPEIVVNPSSFEVEVPADATYNTTMTISNTGNGPLDFTISLGEDADFVKSIEINPVGFSPSDGIDPAGLSLSDRVNLGGIREIPQGKLHESASEGINQGGLLDIFQVAPNPDNSNLEPKQGLHRPSQYEETIHYDGEHWGGVGLSCGGTFEGAIRLTPDELGPYDRWKLISVLFYYNASDTYSGQIKVSEAGSSSGPGVLITSEPYDVNESDWYRIDLTEPVTIDATQDLWTSVEIAGQNYPLGVDAGPAVQGKGDFICSGGECTELYLVDIDHNWNIRAIVAPKLLDVTPDHGTVSAGQSFDINVQFDTYGLTPNSSYTTNILIHNNSIDSLVTIPVTLNIGGLEYGYLEGTVTDSDLEPVDSVAVDVNSFYYDTVYTDSNGFYSIDSMRVGLYDVTFSKTGYYTITEEDVEITVGDTTVLNVILGAPTMDIDPLTIYTTVSVGGTDSTYITVSNNGDAPLEWSAEIQPTDRQVINIPEYTGTASENTSEPSTGLDMIVSSGNSPSHSATSFDILRGSTAWFRGSEYSTYFYGTFDTDTPGDMNEILSPPAWSGYCGDFSTESDEYFYINNPDDFNIYTVDIATGVATLVGPTGLSTFLNGMACDKTDGTMYAVGNEDLYTIDLTTGAATIVGDWIGNQGFMLTLACDGKGDLYGIEALFDILWYIDKNTGLGTEIGPTGFNCNYAQSMAWDPKTDVIYWAAYSGGLDGNIRVIDKTTGNSAFVGDFEGGREVTVLAFPGKRWIGLSEYSGIVPPDCDSTVTVYFDACEDSVGTIHTCDIFFESYPDVGDTTVDVTLVVTEVGVGDSPNVLSTKLNPNFPNPFCHSTKISFSLKEKGNVKLSVYNIKGQLVATLVDEEMNPGRDYKIIWNGKGGNKKLANGIYFYKFETKNKTYIKKMLLMR